MILGKSHFDLNKCLFERGNVTLTDPSSLAVDKPNDIIEDDPYLLDLGSWLTKFCYDPF